MPLNKNKFIIFVASILSLRNQHHHVVRVQYVGMYSLFILMHIQRHLQLLQGSEKHASTRTGAVVHIVM